MPEIIPFSNGSQYMDWEYANCGSCSKHPDDGGKCEIFDALAYACIADGTISSEMATRMGYDTERYVWPCPEHDPPFTQKAKDA